MTYNGWTNYETWNVNLWLANDEGAYRHVQELAEQAKRDAEDSADEIWAREPRGLLADQLKELVEADAEQAIAEPFRASMYADMLNAALSEVDWYEIADAWLADA